MTEQVDNNIYNLLDDYSILRRKNEELTKKDERQDIKFKTTLDKMKFIDRIQGKINKLSNSRVLLQFKYDNVKFYYDIYSIFVIIISAFLTILEAVKNEVNYLEYSNGVKYFFKLTPIIIASIITLLGTYIKFKKYQESSENMSSVLEKSILTIYRLKKLQEKLHYADIEKINLLRNMYLDEIFIFYNQSNAEIRKYMSYTEMKKYENKKLKCDFNNKKKSTKYTNSTSKRQDNIINPPTMAPMMNNYLPVEPINIAGEGMTQNPMMNNQVNDYNYNNNYYYNNNRRPHYNSSTTLAIPSPTPTVIVVENNENNVNLSDENENVNNENVNVENVDNNNVNLSDENVNNVNDNNENINLENTDENNVNLSDENVNNENVNNKNVNVENTDENNVNDDVEQSNKKIILRKTQI